MDGKNLNLLITDVIAEMSSAGFAKGTQHVYNRIFQYFMLRLTVRYISYPQILSKR